MKGEEINFVETQLSNFLFLPKLCKQMWLFLQVIFFRIIFKGNKKMLKILLTLMLFSKSDSTAMLACFL